MQSAEHIQQLILQTQLIKGKAEQLNQLDIKVLNLRTSLDSWSILECIEHLNLYGDFYLPEINQKLKVSPSHQVQDFKSGWLGAYFAKSMLPKEKLNKMKTFKDKNPIHQQLIKSTIDRFIVQLEELLNLLEKSKKVNLNKVKISTSISSLIQLKLGDVFPFLINHMFRHFAQIDRILADSGHSRLVNKLNTSEIID